MIVYELRHEIYVWRDRETIVNTLLFEIEDDAIEYLNIKKDNIIDEYCIELNIPCSIESLRNYINEYDYSYKNIVEHEKSFFIEVENYGYDKLSITMKEILKFGYVLNEC